MIKVGRYTSALLLLTLGGAILLEQIFGGDKLTWLFTWWPLLFIVLGLEYLYYSTRYRNEERRMKLDLLGLMLSIIISLVIVGSVKAPIVINMLKNNSIIDIVSNEIVGIDKKGFAFDKLYKDIPIDSKTTQIKLSNVIGDVIVRSGEVNQLAIQATVWVDLKSEAEAQRIAGETQVQYTSGKTLEINAEGPEYSHGMGVKSPPRIDLTVTVPAELQLDTFKLELVTGTLDIADLKKVENFDIDVTNGEVKLSDLQSVQANLINGELSAAQINGDLQIDVKRGSVKVDQVYGNLAISTNLAEIDVVSNQVGGNWNIENTLGELKLGLPVVGDYSVEANVLGEATTDLPFTLNDDTVTGVVGNGKYQVKTETIGQLEVFQK